MTLIDSSVWIGFLRGDEADVRAVSELVRGQNRASLCGPVLQEVLQGIRERRERHRVRDFLMRLPMLETHSAHYLAAADVYAALRKRGVTVPSVDVLIATLASAAGQGIVTRDRHFQEIQKDLPVEVTVI